MLLAFVPLLIFAGVFILGFFAMWIFARKLKTTTEMTPAGKAVPVESPLGSLDVRPESKLDPRLAAILVYPGAAPVDPGVADVETQVRFGHRDLREVTATYWISTPEEIVWDFYRRELPQWLRNLDHHTGKELIERADDCVRLIRVSTDKEGRTIIETSIKPPGYPDVLQFQRKK